ncbi:hypothetical protein BGZ63DRAFT_192198 [Mariannaea sp. PMI_226]|nr:hypothetical protein BGZ63DRAFT_192198 [Mariannaea sp. PMI_226]
MRGASGRRDFALLGKVMRSFFFSSSSLSFFFFFFFFFFSRPTLAAAPLDGQERETRATGDGWMDGGIGKG